jgi:probable phosphoglycerate mutase
VSAAWACRVLLARHGETEWNAAGRIQGHSDVGLSALGRAQSERLAERFRVAPLSLVVSSDLRRAVETAEPVARVAGVPLALDPDLREQALGEWEGLTVAEVQAARPDQAAAFRDRVPGFRPPGGETREELRERVARALDRHRPDEGEEPVLLVAHGWVIESIVHAVLGVPLGAPRRFALPNAGITRLVWTGGSWFVSSLNDTAHLDGHAGAFPFP